ncbi:MAG: hypothetical protein JST04_04075 [Bdellovibrionales bacterium]|nr:hypothetical protein [Bdellovibrionales bacterium]
MDSIGSKFMFGFLLAAAFAVGANARAEGDPPGAPRPERPAAPEARIPPSSSPPQLPKATPKVVCDFVLAKESVSGVGTPTRLRIGSQLSEGVFLGKQQREDGAVVWYFYDYDRRSMIWVDEREVDFRGPRRSKALQIETQVGPTCFATALGNCAEYVDRFGPVGKVNTPSMAKLRSLYSEFMGAVAFGADRGHAQDVYGVKFLAAHGIESRFADSDLDFIRHVANGHPALLGLRIDVVSANQTLHFTAGKLERGYTPGAFTQTFYPGSGNPHEVLVLGRIAGPRGAENTAKFLVVADSKTGEIHVWPEAEVLASRVDSILLVDLD